MKPRPAALRPTPSRANPFPARQSLWQRIHLSGRTPHITSHLLAQPLHPIEQDNPPISFDERYSTSSSPFVLSGALLSFIALQSYLWFFRPRFPPPWSLSPFFLSLSLPLSIYPSLSNSFSFRDSVIRSFPESRRGGRANCVRRRSRLDFV